MRDQRDTGFIGSRNERMRSISAKTPDTATGQRVRLGKAGTYRITRVVRDANGAIAGFAIATRPSRGAPTMALPAFLGDLDLALGQRGRSFWTHGDALNLDLSQGTAALGRHEFISTNIRHLRLGPCRCWLSSSVRLEAYDVPLLVMAGRGWRALLAPVRPVDAVRS